MDILDDESMMKRSDPSGVLPSTSLFFEQCNQAWTESSAVIFPDHFKHAGNITVIGMGGSRFTPKTVKELFRDELPVPYEIYDDYVLPAYVSPHSLVILSTYSGTTEEVITCANEALKRKAMVTAIARGGPIAQILKENTIPGYIFNPVHNPCGQPRIGSGYLLLGHIGLLKSLGYLKITDTEVLKAIDEAKQVSASFAASVPTLSNPAKQLAKKLFNSHPVLVCSEFLRGWGNCFANQLNETAKMMSDFRIIPELNHHLMEGLKNPQSFKMNSVFLFIQSDLYHPSNRKRMELTREIVEKQGHKTHMLNLKSKTKLSQVLEGYSLSGYTSLYLAMLYGLDPVAIPWVDYFKQQLAKA